MKSLLAAGAALLLAGTGFVARAHAHDGTGTLSICLAGVVPNGEEAWAEGPSRVRAAVGDDGCRSWSVRAGSYVVAFDNAPDPKADASCRQASTQLIAAVAFTRPGLTRVHRHALVSGQAPFVTNVAAGERTEVRYDIRPLCNAR